MPRLTRTLAVLAVALSAAWPLAAQSRGAPAPRGCAMLSAGDRTDARLRLLSLVEGTDVADSEALYGAQQEGMALADAVFQCGSATDQQAVLVAAHRLVRALPTAGQLADRDFLSRHAGRVELRSPLLTRLRQRVTQLPFSVDEVPLPAGAARRRRVFPMLVGERVQVMSEVELQYAYLLSTLVRLAAEHPPAGTVPAARATTVRALFDFLLHDKVRFYWREMPAWHWSGPFPSMRARVVAKLAARDERVTQPVWFGAMVDHELHLFGVAADLLAAARADRALAGALRPDDRALLDDVRAHALATLRRRVTGGPAGDGFLIDYGYWTANPSYTYAGCTTSRPLPSAPCPIDSVATDAAHARRWPWWLRSLQHAWAPAAPEAAELIRYQQRLARQLADRVLRTDARGRPLMANYMDGRDGWYRLREFPGHAWGHGPSTLTGVMRYGSWALLAPHDARIAHAHERFCAVIVSTDPDDRDLRTRYYGSASTKPELGGMGETDLYGPGSLYALTCRIDRALGLH
ncbi:MAG: hypothetical protein ACXWZS_00710 [Gemmatirosa sp.]